MTPVLLENQIVTMQFGWSSCIFHAVCWYRNTYYKTHKCSQMLYETPYCLCEPAITKYFDSL